MQSPSEIPPGELVCTADQRVIMHQVPWAHFEAMLALRGDAPTPRMTYLEGSLELMSPSRSHESIKKVLARMLEMYAVEQNVPLYAYGSWTLRNPSMQRSIEPDECYIIGDVRKETPDLAIEVFWTSGGLDKLEVYRGLGVQEVWLWKHGAMTLYELQREAYVQISKSRILPTIDTELMARLAMHEDQHQAMLEFREYLRTL